MILTVSKRHEKGGATYVNSENGARVQVSKKMFVDGVAPDTIEFTTDNAAGASEKYANRAKRAAEKAAKMVNLPEKLAKAEAKVAKLKALSVAANGGAVAEASADQASA